ncbi:MAG: heavy-metal-associated domain-containing protein [Pseudarthrobacter sp.]
MSTVSTTVSVSGMTCGHCISSVSEELESLAGVEGIDVDLNAGGISTVTISSSQELSAAEIGEAVAEAGYLVVADDA